MHELIIRFALKDDDEAERIAKAVEGARVRDHRRHRDHGH
jgi:hypothetical protein